MSTTPDRPDAQWTLELNVDCPHCGEWVDLLEYADFWDGASFQPYEHGTDATTEVEVTCPECGECFVCNFTY